MSIFQVGRSRKEIAAAYFALTLSLFSGQFAVAQRSGSELSQEDNRRALAFFANAADYQNSAKFELAIDEWQKLVKEYPAHPQASTAWHHLGICNLQQKSPNYSAAIKAFEQALKDDELKLREESLINLSWALFTEARNEDSDRARRLGLEKARERMRQFLKSYSDGAYVDQALFYLGDIEHLLGNQRQSISYFQKLLNDSSFAKSNLRPDAIYALAVAYEEDDKLAQAQRYYDDFVKGYADHRLADEVRLRLGDILLKQNKAPEAERYLSALAGKDASNLADYALLRLGYALSLQGKNAEATEQYLALLKRYPQSKHYSTAALSVGQSLYRSGDYDQALEQFKAASKDDAKAEDAAHWMAITLMRQNKAQQALELLTKTVRGSELEDSVILQMDYADALYAIPTKLEDAAGAYATIANEQPKHPLAARAAYNAAFAALQLGKLKDARDWAEKFLNRYPQDPLRNDVAYIAAEALLQQGEHAASAKAYRKLIAAAPKDPSLSLWQIRMSMANYLEGNYDNSISTLRPIIDRLSTEQQKAEAQFIVGASFLYKDELSNAIKQLSASHQTSSSWQMADEVLLLLAEAQQRGKDNAAARKTLELLLKKYPNSRLKSQAEYKLAQLSAASGQYTDAVQRYRRLARDPESENYREFALYGIVWCQMQQEDFAAALASTEPLLKSGVSESLANEARLAAGICYRKLGKNDQAVVSLERFLQSQPTGAQLTSGRFELAKALTELGKLPAASAQFEKILATSPDYGQIDRILYELAWNNREAGNDQKALSYFSQLAQKFPKSEFSSEANYMLAQQQYDAEQFGEAANTYKQILASTKDSELLEKARYKLGWSQFQQKDYAQAAANFGEQAAEFPRGVLAVDALFMQGECAFKQDDYSSAFVAYQKARDALESSSSSAASKQVQTLIYLHGGQCLRQLKRWNECEQWLNVVVSKFSDSSLLPTAIYELGFCKQNQNQLREALAKYSEVAGNYRNEIAARARFMMGEVYFSQRDFIKAIPEFQRVMYGFGGDRAPEDIKNWQAKSAFEAARCSEVLIDNLKGSARQKVIDAAREYYEFVVQKHGKHELAAKAETRLGELRKLR